MRRLLVPTLALAAGCGLLDREPVLPGLEQVRAARMAEAEDWQLLATAWELRAREQAGEPAGLADWAANHPDSLRLQALLQDFAVQDAATSAEREQLRLDAEEAALATPGGAQLYLAARLAPPARALELLEQALAAEPELVPARVLQLGLQAKAGDRDRLEQLIELLAEHPGSAEGWRLLGQLAPFYARPELAVRAAETEPWLPGGDGLRDRLLLAESALAAGQPSRALEALAGEEGRHARLLRASALAELEQTEQARAILEQLVAEQPRDAMAHFNLGALARDRLERPRLARRHLRQVLELAADGVEVPIQRLTQAERWLELLGPPAPSANAPEAPQ